MHAIDFLRDTAKVPESPVYAVAGDDVFLRREVLSAITRKILHGEEDELAATRFAGDKATLADVLDEVRTVPLFAKRKLVIVESADPFVTAHRRELESYVEHPSNAGVLVLSVKTWPANTKLAKLVEKTGRSIECKGPHERTLVPWLIHLAKERYGAVLEEEAALLLLELVGAEVGLLVSEVEKLVVYVGDRGKIHRDDVARMVGAGRIEAVWHVLGEATTGSGAVALEFLDRLLAAGEEPVRLLAAMTASLRKVHYAGQLRRGGLNLAAACAKAGVFSREIEATGRQHTHLGPRRVDALPAMLLQADLDIKGFSTLPPRVVLETLLVRLAAPRQD